MKKKFSICFLILFSVIIYGQRTILINNVNVVDVEKGIMLKAMHVLVKDSLIVDVINDSQKNNLPVADTAINGKGKYVIPGLWDMHTHVFAPDQMFPLLVANGITGIRDMFNDIRNVNQWRNRMRTGSLLNKDLFVSGPIVDGPRPI